MHLTNDFFLFSSAEKMCKINFPSDKGGPGWKLFFPLFFLAIFSGPILGPVRNDLAPKISGPIQEEETKWRPELSANESTGGGHLGKAELVNDITRLGQCWTSLTRRRMCGRSAPELKIFDTVDIRKQVKHWKEELIGTLVLENPKVFVIKIVN